MEVAVFLLLRQRSQSKKATRESAVAVPIEIPAMAPRLSFSCEVEGNGEGILLGSGLSDWSEFAVVKLADVGAEAVLVPVDATVELLAPVFSEPLRTARNS